MTFPGCHNRFGLCNWGPSGVSKYETVRSFTTRNAMVLRHPLRCQQWINRKAGRRRGARGAEGCWWS